VSEYLFTYGTLRPGRAPKQIAASVAEMRLLGAGHVRGILYDLGQYPGAVLDADIAEENVSAAARIEGFVFELPPGPDILRKLDEYEEFDPASPESSLFIRILHPVKLDSGATLMCWVYVYNRDPAGAPTVRTRP
jgi:gamma-glutamylcyclotransferase (GGCT)/AIG2-like uncharacterized protein YtfP